MKVRKSIAALLLTASLAGCSGDNAPPQVAVQAAQTAARWALYLLRGGGIEFRPTALLGTYVASYLAQGTSLSRTALIGVQQQLAMFFEETAQQSESYQVLQDLGSALAVNVQDLLNRSPNRGQDLDAYIDALRILTASAQRQQEATEELRKQAEGVLREKRRNLSKLQSELSKATREKDYVTAGSLQDSLNTAQQEVASAEAEVKEQRNLLDLYRDVLELAAERTIALVANRDVLIAGVKIVDVPGIEDIGVITDPRARNRGTEGVFGS
jgi:chromosome segregation ATPase